MQRKVQARLAHTLELRAHAMRVCPTASEEALWRAIRSKRLGISFRRQVPVDRYIVDFLAPSAALVVEVDGGWHGPRQDADARRDRRLEALGFRVLRLPAALVERDLPVALARIRGALG